MKFFIPVTIVVLIAIAACSSNKKDNDLDALIAALHSKDSATRMQAREKLFSLEVSEEQQVRLLNEAATGFPEQQLWPVQVILIEKGTKNPSAKHIPIIKKDFPLYPREAKYAALQALINIDQRESIETYAQLVFAHADSLDGLPTNGLSAKPAYANILYPSFLKLVNHPAIGPEVLLLLLNYVEAKAISPGTMKDIPAKILEAAAMFRADIVRLSGVSDTWDSDEYQVAKRNCGIAADLLGHFKTPEVIGELRQYILLKDHYVVLFALKSLLRMGEKADAGIVAAIAADPETRNLLYDAMNDFGKAGEFPAAYKTQAAFAESDMVSWLVYPTELGRTPDAIELMKVMPQRTADGEALFYLFRFRSNHDTWKKDGWIAGVAGYYAIADTPTTKSHGYSFSAFDKWEEKTAEQHLQSLIDIVSDANDKHGDTGN